MQHEHPNKDPEIWNEWKIQETNLRNIKDELYLMLKTKYGESEAIDKYENIRQEGVRLLRDSGLTRQDIDKIVALHILVGGSPNYTLCESFDLDGVLSIENFLSKKLAEEKE